MGGKPRRIPERDAELAARPGAGAVAERPALKIRGPRPGEFRAPSAEQLAKGPRLVNFDLHTGTGECVEYFEYEDGSRGPLPEGTNYYTFALSPAERENLHRVLARVLVERAIERMALEGDLGPGAKERAEQER